MPGSAIGKELNLGYPGTISRSVDTVITARAVKSTVSDGNETEANILFGEPVILNADNTYSRFGSTGTAATFAGIAVREVKQATDYYAGAGAYKPGEVMDTVERGSVTVKCNVGTPTAGGDVFIRTVDNPAKPTGVIGQFEAEADGANSIKIPNVKWKTGKIDSNKVSEITILTRVNP